LSEDLVLVRIDQKQPQNESEFWLLHIFSKIVYRKDCFLTNYKFL